MSLPAGVLDAVFYGFILSSCDLAFWYSKGYPGNPLVPVCCVVSSTAPKQSGLVEIFLFGYSL